MTEAKDNELVKRCLEGDLKAFEELVDRHEKVIYNTALRITNDKDDAKDAAQNAFVKAFENLDKFKPEHKFYSWIYRIVTNEALDIVNRKVRYEDLNDNMISDQMDVEEKMLKDELADQIDGYLMEMDVEARALIALKHYGELSYDELSYVFETSVKKIKSRLYSARMTFRNLLEKKGIFNAR